MERVLIWVIDGIGDKDAYTSLELFSGQNKRTKKGTHSGPLRREKIEDFLDIPITLYLTSLSGSVQSGKSKFLLSQSAMTDFISYCKAGDETALYCRLPDKSLRHVDAFREKESSDNARNFSFDEKGGVLSYCKNALLHSVNYNAPCVVPVPKLYLQGETKSIRGFLFFSYDGITIEANSPAERIKAGAKTILRNVYFENSIYGAIISAGGVRSCRNEITFRPRGFFQTTLRLLSQSGIRLYWGEEKKRVSQASISCSISYDMDWFTVSGTLSTPHRDYNLAELLRNVRGKTYVELDDGICFLPEALKKVDKVSLTPEGIRLPLHQLSQVNRIAEKFQIDPKSYLDKLTIAINDSVSLPEFVKRGLRGYQKEGVKWLIGLYQRGFGGLLADDMGLGKTVQAISFIRCITREDRLPILIVTPKIVLYNWEHEFYSFAPELVVKVLYKRIPFDESLSHNAVYLTTYETVTNHQEYFHTQTFDGVILDEAQYVNHYQAKRYQAVNALNRKFTLALTGTPIENNMDELWSIMRLLNPDLTGTRKAFLDAQSNPALLRHLRMTIAPFILRRVKSDVLSELPPKTEQSVYCEMEAEQRSLYEALLISAKSEIVSKPSRFKIKDNATVLKALLYLREACVDPSLLPPEICSQFPCESCKFSLFAEQIESLDKSNSKVIVYSQFPRILKKLEEWCQSQGWNTFYIDGMTSKRSEIVASFEQSKQGVFFISLKAGGVGINLTTCHYVILYEPWWNVAAERQAADRVYRMGQHEPVLIKHFLVRNSIEEKIMELQNKKANLSSDMLDEMNQAPKLTIEDCLRLLSLSD